jgi:hypothetical protein
MEIIGLGAALGMLVAAACALCYRKGVRDGMKRYGESLPPVASRRHPPSPGSPKSAAFWGGSSERGRHDDEAAAMMRRYEAILSYDPYGPAASGREGERV